MWKYFFRSARSACWFSLDCLIIVITSLLVREENFSIYVPNKRSRFASSWSFSFSYRWYTPQNTSLCCSSRFMFRSNTSLRSVERIYWSLSVSKFGRIRTTFRLDSSALRSGTIKRHMRHTPTTALGFMMAPSLLRQWFLEHSLSVSAARHLLCKSVGERNLFGQFHLDQVPNLGFHLDVSGDLGWRNNFVQPLCIGAFKLGLLFLNRKRLVEQFLCRSVRHRPFVVDLGIFLDCLTELLIHLRQVLLIRIVNGDRKSVV